MIIQRALVREEHVEKKKYGTITAHVKAVKYLEMIVEKIRQMQADLYESMASLVYIVPGQPRAT